MENCLFCKIIKRGIPAEFVHEDDFSIAFLDINPVNIGHTLLLPKEHYENIFDLPDDLRKKLSINEKILSGAVKNALAADGVNVVSNNGKAAGQLIFHAHTHIIPRYLDDGFRPWKGAREYKDGEAKETAEKIRKTI